MCASTSEDRPREKEAETQSECTCLAQLSSAFHSRKQNSDRLSSVAACAYQKTHNARTSKCPVAKKKRAAQQEGFQLTFIQIQRSLCPLIRGTHQALNSHQIESCDVTSRHVLEPTATAPEIKTALWLHANAKLNNSVNKCMFPAQFEESLTPLHLSETVFLLVSCLPSNMWQEFKKLGGACYTVRRGEFT